MSNVKGIILAGGRGTRLYPVTKIISKQLLPVYDKPMIYYSLDILKKSKIKKILIISDKKNINSYRKLLGNGENFNMNFSYKVQFKPTGIPEAFKLGRKFIGKSNVLLVLGDNIFYTKKKINILKNSIKNLKKGFSTIFGYRVKDPKRYGIVQVGKNQLIKKIEEKPKNPKSNLAVIGLYAFTNDVLKIVKKILPSRRGETEIVDIINEYLKYKKLKIDNLDNKIKWFDTGTFKSLLEASIFIANSKK